ncbi:MAG: FtsW/RodA/SpoVE family cell cycle protein [Planctomycetota bacterium]
MLTSGNMLQWIVMCLLGVAVVMVNSAGMSVGGVDSVSLESMAAGRPTIYALLAVGVMVVVGSVRWWLNPLVWSMLLAIGLCCLALAPGFGKNVNGSSRWLYIGPESWNFSFQPSEIAKWVMVGAMAWWAAGAVGKEKVVRIKRFWLGLLPALMLLGSVCGLIAIEDLGTAALIGAVGVGMLVAAGAKLWQLGLFAPPAIGAVYYFVVSSPYRMERITAFLHPWDDPQGAGYQLIQSKTAFASGGLFGRGLGNGLLKFGHLPEDTTDFIFPIICEELGLAGGLLIVGLYAALIWVGLGVIRECRHAFGRLLGLGVMITIGVQALINVAVVTGTVPTKGIALPLVSYGGTGWVLCAGAVGLLVAIDRLNRYEEEAEVEGEEPEPAPRRGGVVSISASGY